MELEDQSTPDTPRSEISVRLADGSTTKVLWYKDTDPTEGDWKGLRKAMEAKGVRWSARGNVYKVPLADGGTKEITWSKDAEPTDADWQGLHERLLQQHPPLEEQVFRGQPAKMPYSAAASLITGPDADERYRGPITQELRSLSDAQGYVSAEQAKALMRRYNKAPASTATLLRLGQEEHRSNPVGIPREAEDWNEVTFNQLRQKHPQAFAGQSHNNFGEDFTTWRGAIQAMSGAAGAAAMAFPAAVAEATEGAGELYGRATGQFEGENAPFRRGWFTGNPEGGAYKGEEDMPPAVREQMKLTTVAQYFLPGIGQAAGAAQLASLGGQAALDPVGTARGVGESIVKSAYFFEPGITWQDRGGRALGLVGWVALAKGAYGRFVDEPAIVNGLQEMKGMTRAEARAALEQAKAELHQINYKDGNFKGWLADVTGSVSKRPLRTKIGEVSDRMIGQTFGRVYDGLPTAEVGNLLRDAPREVNSTDYKVWAMERLQDIRNKVAAGKPDSVDLAERAFFLTHAEDGTNIPKSQDWKETDFLKHWAERLNEAAGVVQQARGAAAPDAPANVKPAPAGTPALERYAIGRKSYGEAPPAWEDVPPASPPAAVPSKPAYDHEAFSAREEEIARLVKESKAAGNQHLDDAPKYVETLRGRSIRSLRNGSTGTIRTVSNNGDVVVHWKDEVSAKSNGAELKTAEGRGKKKGEVWESWLIPHDQAEFVLDAPADLPMASPLPSAETTVEPPAESPAKTPQTADTSEPAKTTATRPLDLRPSGDEPEVGKPAKRQQLTDYAQEWRDMTRSIDEDKDLGLMEKGFRVIRGEFRTTGARGAPIAEGVWALVDPERGITYLGRGQTEPDGTEYPPDFEGMVEEYEDRRNTVEYRIGDKIKLPEGEFTIVGGHEVAGRNDLVQLEDAKGNVRTLLAGPVEYDASDVLGGGKMAKIVFEPSQKQPEPAPPVEAPREEAAPSPTQEKPAAKPAAKPDKPDKQVPETGAVVSSPADSLGLKAAPEHVASHANLAGQLVERLEQGEPMTWRDLAGAADQAFGGSQTQGKYDARDMYDSLEVAVNLYLRKHHADIMEMEPAAAIEVLQRLEAKLPTQTGRTDVQNKLQQFSTVPTEAYAIVKALGDIKGVSLLEPSAGTGSVATFAKLAGAKVTTNEFPGAEANLRAGLLEFQGFEVTRFDAERIDAYMHGRTFGAVAMNPPFSATGGRVKNNKTRYGAMHVENALKLLDPGGRLVAIVGNGMSPVSSGFADWFRSIGSKYAYVANLLVDGSGYAKYGTTFDNRVLIFDNTAERPVVVESTEALSTVKLAEQLERLGNERTSSGSPAGERGKEADHRPEPASGPSPARPGESRPATPGAGGRPGGGTDRAGTEPVAGGQPEQPAPKPEPVATRDGDRAAVPKPEGVVEPAPARGDQADATRGGDDGGKPARTESGVERKAPADAPVGTDELERFEQYRSAVEGAEHPTALVETGSMAGVKSPLGSMSTEQIAGLIHFPARIIKDGNLSDAQLEPIVLASLAHTQTLPGGETKGILVGDGTGVGKGREIAGVIANNWYQGNRRQVWLTADHKKLASAGEKDIREVMGTDEIPTTTIDKFALQDADQNTLPITFGDGVLFMGYDTLGRNVKRLEQLRDWLAGGKGEPVILMDESHKAANAYQDGRGEASLRGQAVIKIQELLPKARVAYFTATAADRVANIAYMTRLGLWGPATNFPAFADFKAFVDAAGIGGQEMLAREMKAMGMYVSRFVAFKHPDGKPLEYSEVVVNATPEMEKMYDAAADAWAEVLRLVEEHVEGGGLSKNEADQFMTQYWGTHQRFFKALTSAFKMPELIRQVEDAIDHGFAPIIALDSTNESSMEQKLREAAANGIEVEDIDFSNKDAVRDFVTKLFPVQMTQEETDPATNKTRHTPVWRHAKSGEIKLSSISPGSEWLAVIDPAKVAMREAMSSKVGGLSVPGNPLDELVMHFGPEAVAEISGRSKRMVRDKKTGEVKIERISKPKGSAAKDATEHELIQFQEGKRHILIITRAGAQGISAHASKQAKNQKQRTHFLFEPGWNTKDEIQKLGRSHRSGQVIGPKYVLMSLDIGGEKRFSSALAAKLAQLGAMQRGDRASAGAGELAKYDFNSEYGSDSAIEVASSLPAEQLQRMGLVKSTGGLKLEGTPEQVIARFFNRLMVLPVEQQRVAYDRFDRAFRRRVDAAKEAGTFSDTVTDIDAVKIEVESRQVVHTDKASGATSDLVELNLELKNDRISVDQAEALITLDKAIGYYKNVKSGSVALVGRYGKPEEGKFNLTFPSGRKQYGLTQSDVYHRWERAVEGKKLWAEKLADTPATRTEKAYVLTGLVLPVLHKLHGDGEVVRIPLPSGERIVGIRLNEQGLARSLRDLGVGQAAVEGSPEQLFIDAIDKMGPGERITLAGGLELKSGFHQGNCGLEIVPEGRGYLPHSVTALLEQAGVLKTGKFGDVRYWIPTDHEVGPDVLKAVLDRFNVVALPASLAPLKKVGGSPSAGASTALPVREPAAPARKKMTGRKGAARVQGEIIPGVGAFIEQDVEPAIKKGIETGAAIAGQVASALSPASLGNEAGRTARVVRARAGELAAKRERARHALKAFQKQVLALPEEERWEFVDRMETGQDEPDPDLAKIAAAVRGALNERVAIIQANDPSKLQEVIENYFPHIWKNEKEASQVYAAIMGKRPLEGSKGFLKQRKIPTIKEGIDAGLEPVTDDPIEMVLLKLHEMDRYIMAQETMAELKGEKIVEFVRAMERPAPGLARIEGPTGTVYGPPEVTIREAFDKQVYEALQKIIEDLGFDHERKVRIGGSDRWGAANMDAESMVTKTGGPETVIEHELGHLLDARYGIWDYMTRKGLRVTGTKGARKSIQEEMRSLADLRYEGIAPSDGFKRYVRNRKEKIANVVHAYIYAPEKMAEVAPTVLKRFDRFLDEHTELQPLREIKPSLVLGSRADKMPLDGLLILGHYYAPEAAARVINNYLSPGLRGSPIYNTLMYVNNGLNQAQLGASAYHLVFTAIDAMTSKVSLGIEEVFAGRPIEGIRDVLFGSVPLAASIENLLRGDKLYKAYLENNDLLHYVDALVAAGGRVKMDDAYRTGAIKKFVQAWRTHNWIGVGMRAPFALVEAMSAPLMEYIVPRMKLGIFMDMARFEIEQLPPDASEDDIRRVLAGVWDSVDNRMGQMVYDNLFWNKVVKDVSHVQVRSVGWNLGTIRELGGAGVDVGSTYGRMKGRKDASGRRGGRRAGDRFMTRRMAYAIALPWVIGVLGAIIQYLYTGKGPESLKDLFMPRTGRKKNGKDERIMLPSYIKDVKHYATDPSQTIENKASPLVGLAFDMWNNEDFFGEPVRNPDHPFVKQIEEVGIHVAKQFVPISVRQATGGKGKKTAGQRVEGFFGLNPVSERRPMSFNDERKAKALAELARAGENTPASDQTRKPMTIPGLPKAPSVKIRIP